MIDLYTYLKEEGEMATPANTMGMGNPGMIDSITLTEPIAPCEKTAKCKKQKKKKVTEGVFDVEEMDELDLAKYNIKMHPKTTIELRNSIINYIKFINPKKGDTIDLNWIDVSNVDSLKGLFEKSRFDLIRTSDYNYDVSKWNVSNVSGMERVFAGCVYFDCDLSQWNVSNVWDFDGMFEDCVNFKGNGLEKWNTGKARSMIDMFNECKEFTGKCVERWNVSRVNNFSGMFRGCKNLDCNLSKWDVSKANNMAGMFGGCFQFNSDLSKWNVSDVWNFNFMFEKCQKFTGKGLDKWDTSHATTMIHMFYASYLQLNNIVPEWWKKWKEENDAQWARDPDRNRKWSLD